jgi:membrane-bound lytic murein transglycosylase F
VVFNNELAKKPKGLPDLIGKSIAVPIGTSYAERLTKESNRLPELRWREVKQSGSDELLEQVAYGLIDYTVADSHMVSLLQNYYPNIESGFTLGSPEDIAWAFSKNGRPELVAKANAFFAKIKKDGTLRNLIDRYYGNAERLNAMDVTTFLKRLRTILPQYKSTFIQAQEMTGIDWRLIAAVSYRESHWDRLNTSPTGVRGMTMLTEDTADMLGVTDRLDAKQSILGGARYMVQLIDTIPARIPEPDRTWMALAAYNIGYAHLEDARVLAQRMKLNPDSWADVKKMLPLLNKYDYYSTLKYGYASGGAPVVFVESIRTYHKILERFEKAYPNQSLDFNIAKAE